MPKTIDDLMKITKFDHYAWFKDGGVNIVFDKCDEWPWSDDGHPLIGFPYYVGRGAFILFVSRAVSR